MAAAFTRMAGLMGGRHKALVITQAVTLSYLVTSIFVLLRQDTLASLGVLWSWAGVDIDILDGRSPVDNFLGGCWRRGTAFLVL